MANLQNSIITNQGLNAVHSFGVDGSTYAIKYFLPIYDPSIDDTIHSSTQSLTSGTGQDVKILSASFTSSDAFGTIQGEKLFNPTSQLVQDHLKVDQTSAVYEVSNSKYIVTSARNIQCGGDHTGSPTIVSGASVTDSSQNVGGQVNLIARQTSAFSEVISASDLGVSATGDFTGDFRQVSAVAEPDFIISGGSNVTATRMLYPITSFTPVNVSAGNPQVDAGRYACQLGSDIGNFKFNKFVLFISKLSATGAEDTSVLPIPFSVHAFEGTLVKESTNVRGSNLLWEGVVDLVFQRSTDTNNVTINEVSTWSSITSSFGLFTPNKVSVVTTSAISNGWDLPAKLAIGDDVLDQLRLYATVDNFTRFKVHGDGLTEISGVGDTIINQGPENTKAFILSGDSSHLRIFQQSSGNYAISGANHLTVAVSGIGGNLTLRADGGGIVQATTLFQSNAGIRTGSNQTIDIRSQAGLGGILFNDLTASQLDAKIIRRSASSVGSGMELSANQAIVFNAYTDDPTVVETFQFLTWNDTGSGVPIDSVRFKTGKPKVIIGLSTIPMDTFFHGDLSATGGLSAATTSISGAMNIYSDNSSVLFYNDGTVDVEGKISGGWVMGGTGLQISASTSLQLRGDNVSVNTNGGNIILGTAGATLTVNPYSTFAASTTATARIRITPGVNPSSPNEGDMWYDGTNLKFQDGVGTKTITWS